MLLAADILASHESLFGSQKVSNGDMSASQVLHDLRTSGGNHPQESLRLQDQYKSQSESVDEKEDNRKAAPGEHREGLAGLRASQASGMRTAQYQKLVESLRSKSCQHEQKKQVPPENLFKRMKCFLQCNLPGKGKGQKNSPQKGMPAPAPAQSWEPGKSRSLVDNRATEAQVPMTAVTESRGKTRTRKNIPPRTPSLPVPLAQRRTPGSSRPASLPPEASLLQRAEKNDEQDG